MSEVEVQRVRLGRAPNCSAAGSVVGAALVSLVAAAAVLAAFADRVARWRDGGQGGGSAGGDGSGAGPAGLEGGTSGDGPVDPRRELRVRLDGDHAVLAWPDPPAWLWVDRAVVEAPGARRLSGGGPLEAHVSLGDRCPASCTGCYAGAGPSGGTVPREALQERFEALAGMGVLEVALGGGEPLARADLPDVLDDARAAGLVPNLTTSGLGLDVRTAEALAPRVGQVNVSLDGDGAVYEAARGWAGAPAAWRAIARLRAAGVPVGVNTVLTRATWAGIDALADRLVAAGVAEWQWLRLKPTGRAAPGYEEAALTAAQRAEVWPRLLRVEARTGLRMRVDCAMVPWIAAHGVPVEAMERLGVLGCPGGAELGAVDAEGRALPCSFAAAITGPQDVAVPLAARWASAPTLAAWRHRAASPPGPCGGCDWRRVCRGGCRVVAAHVTGDALAADPECPRVEAWAETRRWP